jgi:hypothetical protein
MEAISFPVAMLLAWEFDGMGRVSAVLVAAADDKDRMPEDRKAETSCDCGVCNDDDEEQRSLLAMARA